LDGPQTLDPDLLMGALQDLAENRSGEEMLTAVAGLRDLMTDPDFTSGKMDVGQIAGELIALGITTDVWGKNEAEPTGSSTPETFGLSEETFGQITGSIQEGLVSGLATPPDWFTTGVELKDKEVGVNPDTVTISNLGELNAGVSFSARSAAAAGARSALDGWKPPVPDPKPGGNDPKSPGGDTPSSRLARTLQRHGAYDSAVAGKRRITSSFRTDRLGSLKSDHITGNAYDLVGQNLVGYSTLVNRTGGFAEFHGSGANRHLHVVPGEPVGDRVAAMPAAAVAAGAPSSSTSYSIQIVTSPGQDPNAIADAVMAKIQQKQRNMRERS